MVPTNAAPATRLEGGDVHVLRQDLLVVGFSERTSAAALDLLCEALFARGSVTDILVVVMPRTPTAIHLDMLFTQLDRELCAIYPPYFVGPERLAVLHRRKGVDGVREMPDFFSALREVGMPLEPVFCGGRQRTSQDREQWSSACNFVAVRPGTVIGYVRNEATLDELAARRIPRGPIGQLPRVRRLGRGKASHRDHHRRDGTGARWRRASLHDAAGAEGGGVTGLAMVSELTLVDRALARLRGGPAAAAELCAEVLGLMGAPRAVAERVAIAVLGADPRVRQLPDGRWAMLAEAQGSPHIEECAFAVIDLETTGMRARGDDRITEVAVVLVHGERREVVFQSLVNPGRHIPSMISMVTGITNDMVAHAPPFEAIADELLGILAGRIFVAHNARFDWGFLDASFRRTRGLALTGPRLCTVRLARRLAARCGVVRARQPDACISGSRTRPAIGRRAMPT